LLRGPWAQAESYAKAVEELKRLLPKVPGWQWALDWLNTEKPVVG
jgi:hypothetical protein